MFRSINTRSFYNLPVTAILLGLLFVASPARAADIDVGPTRAIRTLAAGIAAARGGDRILLDAGVYVNDSVSIGVPLTIEGRGAGATLQITQPIPNRKGILVVDASLTVRNITFQGAHVTQADGNNGAGIRMQRGDLTVENCAFIANQNGMLINPNVAAIVTITGSRFVGNGAGDGYSHAIYANEVAHLSVADSTFEGTKIGHSIKSRALRTTITNTVIEDGVTGTSSYAIDLPNGGVAVIDGVRITQGPNTDNPAMLAYGAEGGLKATSSLTVRNSAFINQLNSSNAVAVFNHATGISAVLTTNTFQSIPTMLRGPGTNSQSSSGAITRQASIFSTAQSLSQSHLRFYNTGATAGTVKVTLYDGATGRRVAQWQSPSIPPNAAPQVPIATIEAAATETFAKPAYYVIGIEPTFSGSFQHVLFRSTDGTLTNLSICDTGVTSNGAKLSNVHSSRLDGGWPSSLVIYNTGPGAAAVTLGIYDARDGARLGSYTTAPVAAGGQTLIAVDDIEAGAHIVPSSGQVHYTMKVEGPFSGVLQQLVNNERVGVVTDMTAVCSLGS